ncbi:MAG: hypothetical protein NTU81_01840 [Candidatus Nomurabacteria bacterium]|nr:hypothetical protein [Candidatus Nomurabacteria bacterium]
MKKIIVGIFSFALLFVGQNAFATGIWNTASNDCPTINVANTNTSAGWGDPCWNGTNISANPGDIINVRVYYHNTGTTTANNTRLVLNAQTGSSTSHSFTTDITSSQGGMTSNSVSVNIPTSQTLTFGSVIWYTGNTHPTVTPLLNGQDGSEILSTQGLYIGDITPGWSSQGSAVVSFVVGNNTTPVSNCSISNFSSNQPSITNGNPVTLYWSTSNCTNVNISNLNYSVPVSGSQTVWPTYTTTYTLNAYGTNGGTQTRSVTVYVDNAVSNCSINNFSTNQSSITNGNSAVLNWSTNNCTSVNISNLNYSVPVSGSQTVWPTYTTTYTLNAYGTNGGTQTRSVTVYVNNVVVPVPVYNAGVVTTVATNISQTGAQVNGLITNSNYANANTYFEYGTDVYLGLKSSSHTTGSNTSFSEYLTNLSPKTIYFFRAVSEGSNGVSRGAIEIFETLGNAQPVRPIIVQGTTVVGSASPIMLKIENRYQAVGTGDVVDYVVYYKNIGKSKLVNPMVQVFFPKGITVTNASRGTYSADSNTLSTPIEDLVPGAEGVIYIQAKVNSMESNLAQVVTTAVLVYTNPNQAQENAMAYVLNNPKTDGNVLGAAALFGNMSGISLVGLLLLIIFIMLLALLARSLFGRRNVATAPINH